MCCHSSLGTGNFALRGMSRAFCVSYKLCHWAHGVGAGCCFVCCIFHCRAGSFHGSIAFFNPDSLFGDEFCMLYLLRAGLVGRVHDKFFA